MKMGTPKPVKRSPSVTTLLDAVEFNATTTSSNSSSVDCSKYRRGLMHLSVDSTLTPTDIQFLLQFSPDGGTTWHTYKKDEWVSLYYEDTDTATAQTECFPFEVAGRLMRLRAVATGTSAANKFTVTAKVEFYR